MKYFFLFLFTLVVFIASAQLLTDKEKFTKQDTLRGSIGKERSWWNVCQYNISIDVNISNESISGKNEIVFNLVGKKHAVMQIDLQEAMRIDSIKLVPYQQHLKFTREGNVFWVTLPIKKIKQKNTLNIYFSGRPKKAVRPPWDGGWVWQKDEQGRPWVSAAVQGLGASAWYPCKDHQSDEPEQGATFSMVVPDTLSAIANGKLFAKNKKRNGLTEWIWKVKNPINNYLIIPYIGKYVNFTDTLQGLNGLLELSYWVLDYNLEKAKKHFSIVKPMLRCFEDWMGPYPFYEDSYKIVDAPYLGMEHQSAVAYGNNYMNGYLGIDRSATGRGEDWDFIIVHETGHEWFANNITSKDIADMWIHEGFTTYSEAFYIECTHGVEAANEYIRGLRRHISNYSNVVGPYGVNTEGVDMYDKGANLIHTIRQLINNDILFKDIIRGLNKDFYHQTVTTNQIEQYFIKKAKIDLSKIFDQYLRTTQIPTLLYTENKDSINYKWANVVKGFAMPLKLTNGKWIYPTEKSKSLHKTTDISDFTVDPNFYIKVSKVNNLQ